MSVSENELREMLYRDDFPLSSTYDPHWVLDNQMGPNALWLTEWLTRDMELEPGMRVLDMGCGKALSSIFLARAFGVQVWANDWWITATENWRRIAAAGSADRVFPINAEARELPYAEAFFDAIVSIDSYHYYGTDDLYLSTFVKLVKPGRQLGIVVPGLVQDFDGPVPEHLARQRQDGSVFWGDDCWSIHTADWWRHLWGRTGLVDIEVVELMPNGWRLWLQWEQAVAAATNGVASGAELLLEDHGRYLGLIRMIARRKKM